MLRKKSKIILACMALHNFIQKSAMTDVDFDMCDRDENYIPIATSASSEQSGGNYQLEDEDEDMNMFKENLADALFSMRS